MSLENNQLRLVGRETWGALRQTKEEDEKEQDVYVPVGQIIIRNAGTGTETCSNSTDFALILRDLQEKHKKLGYCDIANNFLVASDGTVYEGRGWMTKFELTDDEHADYHSTSYDVAFIGDFSDKSPPAAMLKAVSDLIQFGTSVGFIDKDYDVISDNKGVNIKIQPSSEKKPLDDSDTSDTSEEENDSASED